MAILWVLGMEAVPQAARRPPPGCGGKPARGPAGRGPTNRGCLKLN